MNQPPAQYLLRFDDLCPTMSCDRWARFERLFEQFAIRPILAVVPENLDPDLVFESADLGFWARIRAYEAAGAVIALHGFRHANHGHARGLVPLHDSSEFAGVAAELQRAWIQHGLQILRDHGLHPRLWAAPRHGFDRNTLKALYNEGICYLSDGFASRPVERAGMLWIPQQLWGPQEKKSGLWTICIHTNTAGVETLQRLQRFLEARFEQFTSFDRVIADYSFQKAGWKEWMGEQFALGRVLAARALCRLRRERFPR
ncbi:MAG TPA: DUF2334 domain-containing protein [Terracidiphilus sp.]|nr:DUF2334 domain-containing protein [Terracidiphilus sp.]